MRRAMLPHAVIALVLTLALVQPAAAQPAASAPSAAETILRLSDTATVMRAPDEVVATLRAEARGSSAAAAQEAVNRTIAAAAARAEGVPEVRVATGGYWSGRLEDSRAWQATQVLTLRGAGRPALLDLVGTLQGQGLALVSLHWTLKPETAREARDEATRLALESLQRRAGAVAMQLGMTIAALRELRIDAPDSLPRAAPMMAAMRGGASSGSYAPPVAIADDVAISATVEAVAALRPR